MRFQELNGIGEIAIGTGIILSKRKGGIFERYQVRPERRNGNVFFESDSNATNLGQGIAIVVSHLNLIQKLPIRPKQRNYDFLESYSKATHSGQGIEMVISFSDLIQKLPIYTRSKK